MIAAGPGAGTFVMSPILARSIEELGWRGAFFVMAGIIASVCLLGCAFDPNAPTNPAERDVHREFVQGDEKKKHLSRNPSYLLLVFVTTIVILGNSVPQVHMVSVTKTMPQESCIGFLWLFFFGKTSDSRGFPPPRV